MNTTLILLKDGRNILVSDGERTPRSKYYDFTHNIIMDEVFYNSSDGNCKKIIAGLDSMPSLYYSDKVKQILRDEYGWSSWVHEWQDLYDKDKENCPAPHDFEKGWNCYQSITNKMFSLEDMYGLKDLLQKTSPLMFESATREYIKSLQQPIQLKVEVEMEIWNHDGNLTSLSKVKPKITNNSILITKILKP